MRAQLGAPILAVLAIVSTQRALADPQPLWEFGLGIGVVAFNDYRGAASAHAYPVPVPYFVYRGPFLRSDRDGVHGLFFDRRYLKLDISLNATAPVFSRDSQTRAGMPNLDSTLEFGPALEWHIWRSSDEHLQFNLRAPVRNALTLASPPRSIGWVFAPNLSVDYQASGRLSGWNLGVLTGPIYAQRRYDDYFYSVAPRYATLTRPAYAAPGGYGGSQVLASVSKQFKSCWVGAYVRHDWLQGAVFNASPLVQQHSYWAGGFGIVWMIRASTRMVDSNE